MKKLGFGSWLGIVLVVAIVFLVWLSHSAQKSKELKQQSMTSRQTALLCTTDMATQYHIHPELKIFIRGQAQVIPAQIGIMPTCMNSIHTHDASGKIHIESPIAKDFTLGDFFAVWGKDFSRTKILDAAVGTAGHITVTVNGKMVDTYETTVLRDKDNIVISYQ